MNNPEQQLIPIQFKYKEKRIPESLLSLCLNYITKNLHLICSKTSEGYTLHEGVILPSKICDLLIQYYQNNNFEFLDDLAHLFKDKTKTKLCSVHIHNSKITDNGLEFLLSHDLHELSLINCPNLTHKTYITNLMKHDVALDSLIIHCQDDKWFSNDVISRISVKSPKLKHLQFNMPGILDNNTILNICSLQSLVVLDLSQSDGQYPNPSVYIQNNVLAQIVNSLPNLMYLDISNTNLAGQGRTENPTCKRLCKYSDIPGLENRVDNPLEFLGLFKTMHDACRRLHIPAKKISGDANEHQLYNAAVSSMKKPKYLQDIMIEYYNLFSKGQCTQIDKFIDILLEVVNRNRNDKGIQKRVWYTILLCLKNRNAPIYKLIEEKRLIILKHLLMAIEYHYSDDRILYYYDLIMKKMKFTPKDLLTEYKSYLLASVKVIGKNNELFMNYFTSRVHNLINHMNCEQKDELGDVGAIEKLKAIINTTFKTK